MYGDRGSYEKLWEQTICRAIETFIASIPSVSCVLDAKESIWSNYVEFNGHSRKAYMHDPEGRLDRHKVAACYMLAILKTSPLKVDFIPREKVIVTVNEHLAIMVGLSILQAFLTAPPKEEVQDISQSDFEKNISIFGKGFDFPKAQNGDYRNNFAIELYFTKKEESFNILSLSNTLYLLEEYMRQKWKIECILNSDKKN